MKEKCNVRPQERSFGVGQESNKREQNWTY